MTASSSCLLDGIGGECNMAMADAEVALIESVEQAMSCSTDCDVNIEFTSSSESPKEEEVLPGTTISSIYI